MKPGEFQTSDLPPWKAENDYYEEYSTTVQISKRDYENLRARRLPVFKHQTYYEGDRDVVFIPERQQAVVILEGGL